MEQPDTSAHLNHLLSRCALRDFAAFEALYQASSAQLFGLAMLIVRDPHRAEEVLQEVYLKVWRKPEAFRPELGNALTWLRTVTHHQCIDHLRRNHPERLHDPDMEPDQLASRSDSPQTDAEHGERTRDLGTCLKRLSESHRRTLIASYWRGLTLDEIARDWKKPLGTVKSWARRGMQQLRTCIDALKGDHHEMG